MCSLYKNRFLSVKVGLKIKLNSLQLTLTAAVVLLVTLCHCFLLSQPHSHTFAIMIFAIIIVNIVWLKKAFQPFLQVLLTLEGFKLSKLLLKFISLMEFTSKMQLLLCSNKMLLFVHLCSKQRVVYTYRLLQTHTGSYTLLVKTHTHTL